MTLEELIREFGKSVHPFESLGTTIFLIVVLLCTVVQVAPIKINPWDKILGWIGNRFNYGINAKIEKLDKRIDTLETGLNEHILGSKIEYLKSQRRYIINFVNEGLSGVTHSRESFEDMIKACDEYEEYIEKNHLKNGVIESSIHIIRERYDEHLRENDFPTDDIK